MKKLTKKDICRIFEIPENFLIGNEKTLLQKIMHPIIIVRLMIKDCCLKMAHNIYSSCIYFLEENYLYPEMKRSLAWEINNVRIKVADLYIEVANAIMDLDVCDIYIISSMKSIIDKFKNENKTISTI